MSRVVLYGTLAERFGDSFNLSVHSAHDAVRFLGNLVPGFREHIREGSYCIVLGNELEDEDRLELDEDLLSLNTNKTIHILPEINGAKAGLFKTILGTVLIVVGFFLPPGFAQVAQTIGANLLLTGVTQLLTPSSNKEKKQSYLLDGPSNIQVGQPVPIVYGTVLAGTAVISFDIDDTGVSLVDNGTNTFYDYTPQDYEINV